MNTKTVALSAALAAGLMAPIAQANAVPATYVTGVVTGLDAKNSTLTVDGTTYVVGSRSGLLDVSAGDQVAIAYVMENGKRIVIGIDIAEDNMADMNGLE